MAFEVGKGFFGMFDIGSFRAATCKGIGRRSFLKWGASVPAGLMLGQPRILHAAPASKAKSVIFVWLWGAPSHIDTF